MVLGNFEMAFRLRNWQIFMWQSMPSWTFSTNRFSEKTKTFVWKTGVQNISIQSCKMNKKQTYPEKQSFVAIFLFIWKFTQI